MSKRIFASIVLAFLLGEQAFACGGCVDTGVGYSSSSASIQNLLQEETRTAAEILKEALIVAQSMATEKSNDLSIQKIERFEKEILSKSKKEIFLLEQQNKLESSNVSVKSMQ